MMRAIEFKTISSIKISEYNNITYRKHFQSIYQVFEFDFFPCNFK